jgi:hypothetical protein
MTPRTFLTLFVVAACVSVAQGSGPEDDGVVRLGQHNKFPTLTIIPEVFGLAAGSHYGDPYDGCLSDEIAIRVQGASGASGAMCSPMCNAGACPSDVPTGCKATPQCVLSTGGGKKYCALVCRRLTDCGPGPKAYPEIVDNVGTMLCTYDS